VGGPVERPVSPLADEGLDEPLGLAVGLRTVRPDPLVACTDPDQRLGVAMGVGVDPAVVGEDSLDRDTPLGKEGRRLEQCPGGGRAVLGDMGDLGDPAHVVHDHLEMVVTPGDAAPVPWPVSSKAWC